VPISVSTQAYIFLCAIVGGIVIAFIYDIFRVKRKAVKTSAIVIYVEDLVFWLIVVAVMFAVLFFSNEGEIRGYIFIGTILGIILYNLIFSRIVMAAFLFILKMLYKALMFLWRLAAYPFKILFKMLSLPARHISKTTKKAFHKVRGAGKNSLTRFSVWRKSLRNIRKKV